MKKSIFWILLCIEFLFCWVSTDIFVGRGWLNALLLIGGNLLFVKLAYARFQEWFEPPEVETASAVQNAVLTVTATEILLFQGINIWLYYAI